MNLADEKDELEKRLAEYAALEASMHSGSSVSYSLLVGFFAAAFAFIAAVFTLLYQGNINILVATLLMLLPIMLLFFAKVILRRFEYMHGIRMARAVEIEEQLGFYSFRLLEPWKIAPTDEYYRILGELARGERWNKGAASKVSFTQDGEKYFNNPPRRESKTLELMHRIIVTAISLCGLMRLVSFFVQLAEIGGAVLTAFSILLIILILTGLGNWLT